MIMALNVTLLLGCASLLLSIFLISTRQRVPKGLRLPPGPRGRPIFGSALEIGSNPRQIQRIWAQKYGEVVTVKVGLGNFILLNSALAVREILDRQSAITSNRFQTQVTSRLVSGGMRINLMDYSPLWRSIRTIVHHLLTPKASAAFKPSQEFEAKQLLYDILTDNKDLERFYVHVRRYSNSVMLTSTYGIRSPNFDNPVMLEVYRILDDFKNSLLPGTFIADQVPVMAQLPVWMQWWRKQALAYYNRQEALWMQLWNQLQQKRATGKAPECFVKRLSETDYHKQGISDKQAAFVAGGMIEAGSETTSAAVNSCILYLAANPAVQERANQEITGGIGDTRSPNFEDEEKFPFIRSIIKEILRIRPSVVFGPTHYSSADIVYKDYFIPKNSLIVTPTSALHYDAARYEEPFAFRPERFDNDHLKAGASAVNPDPDQRDHFSFGTGRRICPGLHLSENSMFILLSKLLWAFEIRPALGPDGKEMVLDTSDEAFERGALTVAKPFKARFIPRNDERANVIRREWEAARAEGFYLGNVKVDVNGMVVDKS